MSEAPLSSSKHVRYDCMNSMSQVPTVHVVIVNWNAGSLLAECLRSFEAVSDDAVALSRITIVDNCSNDDSLCGLDELAVKLPLEFIRNSSNRGFAAACNQGARGSDANFLLFLNPDTRICSGSLETPALFLADAKNSRVGIVGVQLIDRHGNVARSCARRPTVSSMVGQSLGLDRSGYSIFPSHFLSEWDHCDTRTVDQVMGAFFFLRSSMFAKIGGFDERFFVYFEDMDLAVRARELGWTSVYIATARAFHHGSGTTEHVKDLRLFYYWRSRILYAFKHFNVMGAAAIAFLTLSVEPIIRALALLANKRPEEISKVLRATHLLWSDLPKIVRGDTRSAAV
jgi:N-acetylglucosaminyl-diphospho-decaprenol L-rhamnosyltransferase